MSSKQTCVVCVGSQAEAGKTVPLEVKEGVKHVAGGEVLHLHQPCSVLLISCQCLLIHPLLEDPCVVPQTKHMISPSSMLICGAVSRVRVS